MCKFKTKITEIFDISNCSDWNMSLLRNHISFIDPIDFPLPFFLEGGRIWYMYYPLTKPRDNFYSFYYYYFFFWKISLFDCFYIYISFSYIWNLKKKKSIGQNYKIYGENKKTCFQQTPLGSHSIYNFRNDTLGNLEGKQIFLLSKKSLY